jgi:hypothetical protein
MIIERLRENHDGDAYFDKSLYRSEPNEKLREKPKKGPEKNPSQDEINKKGLAELREVLKKSKESKK